MADLRARTSILAMLRRWPRLWAAVITLLVASQIGLLLHQGQHQLNPHLLASDECTLCQFAVGMSAPPAPPAIILPVATLVATIHPEPVRIARQQRTALAFRSRAPPLSIAA